MLNYKMRNEKIKLSSILLLLFAVLFLSGCSGGDSINDINKGNEIDTANNGGNQEEIINTPEPPQEEEDTSYNEIIDEVTVPDVEEDVEIGDLII